MVLSPNHQARCHTVYKGLIPRHSDVIGALFEGFLDIKYIKYVSALVRKHRDATWQTDAGSELVEMQKFQ